MNTFTATLITTALLAVYCIYLSYLLLSQKKLGKSLLKHISELEHRKTALQSDLLAIQQNIEKAMIELKETRNKNKLVLELKENEGRLRQSFQETESKLKTIQGVLRDLDLNKQNLMEKLGKIKADLSLYSPIYDFIEVGFVEEPEYLFEISERYKIEIKAIREQQKDLISNNKAITVPVSYALHENTIYATKIMDGQVRLMLKAFNIECDLLISSVRSSTYSKVLERIEKVANELEKNSISLKAGFTKEFVALKFQECTLQYQFKMKEEREQEEQQRIKEQMREEQKAMLEYERALAKAQKEEQLFRDALEFARKELAASAENEKAKLEDKVRNLEKMLLDAQESAQRAKSMAEQTRRGHVYIISNIGSFGDDIYKIGLTRRLEPLERVKELGGASVPFTFDVHAMIFSEDAPALEATLHREFTKRRVNQVNYRKEFFKVSLDEVRQKALDIFGKDIEFKMTALAEEYKESRRLRGQPISQTPSFHPLGSSGDSANTPYNDA